MLTSGDDSLQSNDIGMVELPHDAGLAQKVTSLLLWISSFQTLDGHLDLPLTGQPQTATANLSKLTWESNKSTSTNWNPFFISLKSPGELFRWFTQVVINFNLPAPITLSIRMLETSISLAKSRTAWLGSSYVCGWIYVRVSGSLTAMQEYRSEYNGRSVLQSL